MNNYDHIRRIIGWETHKRFAGMATLPVSNFQVFSIKGCNVTDEVWSGESVHREQCEQQVH